jgi:phage gp46-like protein
MRKTNYKLKVPEPRLPLQRVNGSLVRCDFEWENIPIVQLQSKTGWWGNLVDNSSVGSIYADNADDPILADGRFLARRSAEANAALTVLKKEKIARKIAVEVTNPYADRTEAEITLLTDAQSDKAVVLVVSDYRKPDPSIGRVAVLHNDPFGVSEVLHNDPGGTSPVAINTPEGT